MNRLLKNKHYTMVTCVIITLIIDYLDYSTGYELDFLVLYFIPISVSMWFVNKVFGMSIALLCVIVWFFADIYAEHQYSFWHVALWNVVIRCLSFFIIGFLLSRIKESLDREKQLNKVGSPARNLFPSRRVRLSSASFIY